MTQDRGSHLAPPRSRTIESVLFGGGMVVLAIGAISAMVGADATSALVMLGASCIFGGIVERMRTDPSAWKLQPGGIERRVVLVVLGTLSALMGLAAVFQIAGAA